MNVVNDPFKGGLGGWETRIDLSELTPYPSCMIFSRVAAAVLLCALALAWLSTWGQMRASLLGDSHETCWFEIEQSEQSQKGQHDCFAATTPCLSMEPASYYATLVEIDVLSSDIKDSLAAPKRGPPANDS